MHLCFFRSVSVSVHTYIGLLCYSTYLHRYSLTHPFIMSLMQNYILDYLDLNSYIAYLCSVHQSSFRFVSFTHVYLNVSFQVTTHHSSFQSFHFPSFKMELFTSATTTTHSIMTRSQTTKTFHSFHSQQFSNFDFKFLIQIVIAIRQNPLSPMD